ncbi:hypothetical protein CG471_13685 [Sphingobium sp. IP1]|uniref:cysteine desulfurase family protein n=1 Tax=Sphingobium sp. IP1 TaxID=2021637 RepID=UPI000C07F298|nr:cysteine desulfurase family protein [Sphingobium sp. IP1]PHP19185.1 hypothetical protein CG471_13685 [Sphingobium sp. IP1]
MTRQPIYLDGFSTTPLAPEALAAMQAAWAGPGNASSPHAAGQRALAILDRGRKQVADLIGCSAGEVIFTSGATEANNLALRGIAEWGRRGGSERRRVVVSAIEHKAVLEAAKRLVLDRFEVVVAPVDRAGVIDLTRLEALVDDETLLVSVMLVNNETGVVQPIREVAQICRSRGVLLHSDGAQGVGKRPVNVFDLGVDYLSISAHKLYGPMGVGALYVASDAPKPVAQVFGGGHERGMRAGTEPVPLVAGFGAAAEVARSCLEADSERSAMLKDAFVQALSAAGVSYNFVTERAPVIDGGLALSFPSTSGDDLAGRVSKRLCISTGSACNSGQVTFSHVLQAMGIDGDVSQSVVRFFFGRMNTIEEVRSAALIIAEAVNEARTPLDESASERYGVGHEACAYRP